MKDVASFSEGSKVTDMFLLGSLTSLSCQNLTHLYRWLQIKHAKNCQAKNLNLILLQQVVNHNAVHIQLPMH